MSQRQRGVVLTNHGKERLDAAIAAAQELEKDGKRFTQAELEERSQLSVKTIKKIRQASVGVDKSKIEDLFLAFELTLDAADYGVPEPNEAKPQHHKKQNRTPKTDLLEAPDASIFYGREAEMLLLRQWALEDKCRLIALIGMGGMGKTALSVRVIESVQAEFDYVIWRSLREAPPLERVLSDVIKFLSDQQDFELPQTIGETVKRLVHYLNQSRCLVVFDNAESILAGGDRAGQYRDGYEGYGNLLQQIGELRHRSCLILTSREKPAEVARLEGRNHPVRSYSLQGLEEFAGQEFLKAEGLNAAEPQWKKVFHYYSGNPLALKVAANSIQDLFNGNITNFISQGPGFFGDVRDLLEQQFERLSGISQSVMYWLAIHREGTVIEQLKSDMLEPSSTSLWLETLESLKRRSLIESSEEGFTLQNVVMEYVTDRLVMKVVEEIKAQQLNLFNHHALMQATTKDYIRETQNRLILFPVAQALVEKKCLIRETLNLIHQNPDLKRGYAAGNLLNIICYLGTSPSDTYDFSGLTIRNPFLKDVHIHNIHFIDSEFIQANTNHYFSAIGAVAISPDGQLLAAGDLIGNIYVWHIENRQLLKILSGHQSMVRTVAFHPYETLLASGSEDETIRIWNLELLSCERVLRGHTHMVRSIAFSPDGTLLASGSNDETIKLWKVPNFQLRATLKGHLGGILSVSFSPDSQYVISGSRDHTIRIWHLHSHQCTHTLEAHSDMVRAIRFSHDGTYFISGGNDNMLRIWDFKSLECLQILEGHENTIMSIAFSPDGKLFATGSSDRTVRLWETGSGDCIWVFKGHDRWINEVTFSPDGRYLAAGSGDMTVWLWDLRSRQCTHNFKGYVGHIFSLAFSSDGKTLASASSDLTARLWHVQTGECIQTYQGHSGWVRSVSFSPGNTVLATASEDKTIRLWDTKTHQLIHHFLGSTDEIYSLAFSPDGKTLAFGSHDATVRLLDLETMTEVHTWRGHIDLVNAVAFSPDGKTVASASSDRTIRIWDVGTRELRQTLKGHTSIVMDIAPSPDGRWLASAGRDNLVRIWKTGTYEQINQLTGHTNFVTSVAFCPNSQVLASGSGDATVRLWDMTTFTCIAMLSEHQTWVRSLAFSPDGNMLVSGDSEGIIHFWDLATHRRTQMLKSPKPYDGIDITGSSGLSEDQRASMLMLGAVEHQH